LFKDLIDKENISLDNSKENPFVLELGDTKNEKRFIPVMNNLSFKEFLEQNKNIDINSKNNKANTKDEIEDEFEINNLCDKGEKEEKNRDGDLLVNADALPNSNIQQSKVNNNNNKVGDIESTKSKNEKSILINISNISNEDKTKNSEYKEVCSNCGLKTIKIIWNTGFLIKSESNNNYYLANKQDYNTIELWSFFQKMYDNYFGKISIDKCFEEFTKEEEFDADNLWKCSKCHNNIPAKNKIEIYQTPKILIIQLKRFKNNEKINTFVEFPLTNLDISRFVSHNKSKYNGLNKKYDLFAVANRYGGLEYGDYDAYCLNYIDNH
jgi:ribosomal protein L37AE/L43A